MVVIAMAQTVVVFNITTLQIAIDGIAYQFNAPASSVETAMVLYWLVVATLVLPAARLAPSWGARRVFRGGMVLFAVAMIVMASSPGTVVMISAQMLTGVATAAVMPTLVLLVAEHYRGDIQRTALNWLATAQAVSIVPALLVAGALATWLGWRVVFGLLVVWGLAICILSGKMRSSVPQIPAKVDSVGLLLETLSIFLIGWGCNKMTDWSASLARSQTSSNLIELSQALSPIVLGVILVRVFFAWERKYGAAGGIPLIALGMLGSRSERSVLLSIFSVGVLSAAITFVIPLYMESVQGRTSLFTAVALMPFAGASFAAGVLVVRLRGRVHPRRIARYAFLLVAIGAALLGETMRGRWSDFPVITGMVLAGLGEGALSTLLFKFLVTRASTDPTGNVTATCNSTDYFASAIGTALASVLVIGMLSASVQGEVLGSMAISPQLKEQINLDNVSFVSNDRLRSALSHTTATPPEVKEAVRINTQVRLHALRVCFFALAALAALAFFPAAALPDWSGV
jgi:MFS family permease